MWFNMDLSIFSVTRSQRIARCLGSVFLLMFTAATPAWAAYVIAPDIAEEYVRVRTEFSARPDDPATVFEYAVCLSYVGKVEDGRKALRKVRSLDPDFATKALPRYQREVETRPQDPRALFRIAFLYYFLNDNERAYTAFETVAKQQPPGQLTTWALAYMAVICSDAKKWGEAESLIRRALEMEPDAYGLHAALAATLRGQGRIFAATGEFFTALNLRTQFENYERERFPVIENGKN
jgi:tetratricopeptide (TPR) repeat protein